MKVNIGIIGCGNMGEAIIKGVLQKRTVSSARIFIYEKKHRRANFIKQTYNIRLANSYETLMARSQVVIIAVKPQDVKEVLASIKNLIRKGQLLISIAAGIKLQFIKEQIGKKEISIIRVMPNIAAVVGSAFSALSLSKEVNETGKSWGKTIFSALGEVMVIKEQEMDAITALSGSGPGFFAYFAQAMVEAAAELKIPKKRAQNIIRTTLIGTAKLIEKHSIDFSGLVKKVASPKGTTQAAIDIWNEKEFKLLVKLGIRKAWQRSKELSNLK
jgi:pyrroline-5-carboxylate reductase